MRIGIILAAVLILATVVVGGITVVGNLGGKGNPSKARKSPSPSPGSQQYYSYNDTADQFSLDRPTDWTERILTNSTPPDANGKCYAPCIALTIGPPEPYPNADYVAVFVQPLPHVYTQNDLNSFKTAIQDNYITTNSNIIGFGLTASRNLPGWEFQWTSPGVSPTVVNNAYFFLDGDHMIVVQLQVQPPGDTQSLGTLTPIWSHIGQTLSSFYPIPSAAPATSSPPTSTATPTSTASP